MSDIPMRIIPKEQIIIRVATSIQISVERIELYKFAQIQVQVFDINKHVIDVFSLRIEGEEYENWSSDDDYIINLVCEKFGYQLAPVEPEPVTPVVEPTTPVVITEPIVAPPPAVEATIVDPNVIMNPSVVEDPNPITVIGVIPIPDEN